MFSLLWLCKAKAAQEPGRSTLRTPQHAAFWNVWSVHYGAHPAALPVSLMILALAEP